MAISPEAYEAASRRAARQSSDYGASAVRYDVARALVVVTLVTGHELQVSPLAVDELAEAPASSLAEVQLSASGLSLHFPSLEVDLSIPNLVHREDGRRIKMVA